MDSESILRRTAPSPREADIGAGQPPTRTCVVVPELTEGSSFVHRTLACSRIGWTTRPPTARGSPIAQRDP